MAKRTINLNYLDCLIAKEEGGKVNLPIGQIKEVRRITMELLAVLTNAERCDCFACKQLAKAYHRRLARGDKKMAAQINRRTKKQAAKAKGGSR